MSYTEFLLFNHGVVQSSYCSPLSYSEFFLFTTELHRVTQSFYCSPQSYTELHKVAQSFITIFYTL
jgi:hypothetical protein